MELLATSGVREVECYYFVRQCFFFFFFWGGVTLIKVKLEAE